MTTSSAVPEHLLRYAVVGRIVALGFYWPWEEGT